MASPGRLPPISSSVSKVVISDSGQAVGVLLEDRVSATLNFGGEWIRIPGPSTGCLAVADGRGDSSRSTGGIAAVPRPDGSIEILRADRPRGPSAVLGRDRAGGRAAAPSSRAPSLWPRARPARDLAFDPSARKLAVASAQSLFLMVWDVQEGKLLAAGEHFHAVTSVAWNAEAPTDADGLRTPESERSFGDRIRGRHRHHLGSRARQDRPGSEDHLFMVPTRRLPPPTNDKVEVRQFAFTAGGRQLMSYMTIAYWTVRLSVRKLHRPHTGPWRLDCAFDQS